MVDVPVVVRDSNGAVVSGLSKEDFEVYDQGKIQDITFFSVELAGPASSKVSPINPAGGAASAPVAAARKPRFVAFYFDDFNMSPGDTNASRDAAMKFVREGLEPGDKVGVYTTSTSVSEDFTDDKQKLLDALGKIRTHQKIPSGAGHCPNLTTYQAYLIMQNPNSHSDALDLGVLQSKVCGACPDPPPGKASLAGVSCASIVQAIAGQTLFVSEDYTEDTLGIITDVIHYLGKMPGKRTLVLASSGFMVQTIGPQHFQEKVIDAALHDDIVINSIDAKGLWTAPPGGDPANWMNNIAGAAFNDPGTTNPLLSKIDGLVAYQDELFDTQKAVDNDPLAEMAEGTGGRFFHNSNDLLGGFREMTEPPEVSYVLGFSPDNVIPDGKLHGLTVKLINHRRGQTATARHGYYAPSKKDADELAAAYARREKMEKAVLTDESIADISAEVKAQPGRLDDGTQGLKVSVHVDAKNLPFAARNGHNFENLIFISALFDEQNHFLSGVQGYLDLNVKDATLTQLSSKGVDADLSLKAPPGRYRLRQVVQEEATGRLVTINTPVEIR